GLFDQVGGLRSLSLWSTLSARQVLFDEWGEGYCIVKVCHVGDFAVVDLEVVSSASVDWYSASIGGFAVPDYCGLVTFHNNMLRIHEEFCISSFDRVDGAA